MFSTLFWKISASMGKLLVVTVSSRYANRYSCRIIYSTLYKPSVICLTAIHVALFTVRCTNRQLRCLRANYVNMAN